MQPADVDHAHRTSFASGVAADGPTAAMRGAVDRYVSARKHLPLRIDRDDVAAMKQNTRQLHSPVAPPQGWTNRGAAASLGRANVYRGLAPV